MITLDDFTIINSYEDCPLDQELLVWTGDSFDVEYVTSEAEFDTTFPANGVEFIAYIVLPDQAEAFKYFEYKAGI